LGCKNIHELPEVAEEAMGYYFYVFFFEVETIVVSGEPNLKISVYVDSYCGPSPKRQRFNKSPGVQSGNKSSIWVFLVEPLVLVLSP
jgi:hypothetical protein